RVLEGLLPEHADRPRRGEVLRREHGHRGGLARTVASEEPVDRMLLDAEAQVVDCSGAAVALGEVLDLDDGGHHASCGERWAGWSGCGARSGGCGADACSVMSRMTSCGPSRSRRASAS